MPLQHGPEGLFKRVEIGINNYGPSLFMNQAFTIYFFKEKNPISAQNEEQKSARQATGLMPEMPRCEYDVLMDRIENDLVAFGEF